MNVRALFYFAVFGFAFLVSGCVESPSQSNLAGNWIIVGPPPTNNLLSIGAAPQFSLAMTFDSAGNQADAPVFVSGVCTQSVSPPPIFSAVEVSFGTVTNGIVASDGSFTVQTAASESQDSITVRGKAPQVKGGDWSGSYTASFNFQPECVGSSSGDFTATSFPLINGVYVGAGSAQVAGVSKKTPVTFRLELLQGGAVTDPNTGVSKPSSAVLSGDITIQGSSCFSSGTISTSPGSSSVLGNEVFANFTMDDGSTLTFSGVFSESTEEIFNLPFITSTEGKCGRVDYEVLELDRLS